MGDLRVAVDDLPHQFLAQVHGLFRLARQVGQQFVEALEKQCVVFLRHLFCLAQGGEDGAQVGEQGEVMFDVGSGHGKFRQ
ncbi:hypothetical protein D3C81_1980150 [compost metagenome]